MPARRRHGDAVGLRELAVARALTAPPCQEIPEPVVLADIAIPLVDDVDVAENVVGDAGRVGKFRARSPSSLEDRHRRCSGMRKRREQDRDEVERQGAAHRASPDGGL